MTWPGQRRKEAVCPVMAKQSDPMVPNFGVSVKNNPKQQKVHAWANTWLLWPCLCGLDPISSAVLQVYGTLKANFFLFAHFKVSESTSFCCKCHPHRPCVSYSPPPPFFPADVCIIHRSHPWFFPAGFDHFWSKNGFGSLILHLRHFLTSREKIYLKGAFLL